MATILCINDAPVPCQSLALLLQFAGHRCLIASDSNAAEQFIRDGPIDLVVLDVASSHPVEAEGLVKRLRERRKVPVLMLTDNPHLDWDIEQADVMIRKPYQPDELLGAVARLLAPQVA